MEFREHLLKMVSYEEYANGLWLDYLEDVASKPNGGQFRAEAEKWLWHICGCYNHWFNWLEDSQANMTEELRTDLGTQYARMKAFIGTCDLEQARTRSFPEYGTWTWTTRDVILHTLTHGGYHRGHIRSIAESQTLADWPDTDWEEFSGVKVAPPVNS